MNVHDVESLEELAYKIAEITKNNVKQLNLDPSIEFRRYFDGVSGQEYILLKLISEILIYNRPDIKGLVKCVEKIK